MISEIASALFHKDAGAYGDEYQTFLKELRTFHDARGTSFNKLPRVHGREIDLYLLYTLVTTSGGWEKVTAKDDWGTLLPYFGIPRACSNGDSALKQVYVRYLDVYERIHFLGEEVDRRESEMHEEDDSRNKRRNLRLLHALPITYNHQQHQITSSVREYAGLSTELAQLSFYERLMLSLLSPLPNEQDFAVNICTLLGGDGKHKLVLDQCPKLVDVLLAHAGVFATVDLRNLLVETYRQSRSMNLEQFWRDVVSDPQIRDLVYRDISQELDKEELSLLSSEDTPFTSTSGRATPESVLDVDVAASRDQCPSPKKRVSPSSFCGGTAVALDGHFVPEVERLAAKRRNEEENQRKMEIETEDRDLFNLGRDLGSKDVLGHRVLQIAMLLRNLSFEEGNVATLAKNSTVLRFLLLGWHSQWNSLPQMALDALSNLAAEVSLNEPADCAVSAIFLDSLTRGLQAQDRFCILSCMEIVTKLCGKEENEHILSSTLDQNVYESLCRLLTVPDIMLLIYTLESLYALSDLGETACNNILRCQGALDVLVSMLTVEAQSFGPKACILMRVVETAGESDSRALSLNATASVASTTITPLAAAIATPVATSTAMSAPTTTMSKPANMTPSTTKAISRVGTPSSSTASILTRPATKAATTVTKVTAPTMATPPAPVSASAPAYLPAEKEKAAIAWLKSMFDISLGAPSLEQGALYRLYSNAMTQAGNKLILASSSFYSAVKLAFGGSVGPFRKQVGQIVEFHYESLKPKGNLGVNPPETPSILQAHLSSPPKTQTKREQDKTFLPSTPSTSSVDNKASTNSLLIKSLLANKVNETPPTPSTLVVRAHHPSTSGPPTSISMDLNVVLPAPDTTHVHVHVPPQVPVPHVIASPITSQVVKRQQQQKLHPIAASETQVNGVKLEKNDKPEEPDVKPNEMGKGLLANLLEKEIPRTDSVNGSLTTGRELRISDKGLELVINAANEPSVLSAPTPVPPPATTTTVDGGKVIAQVDDAGHVQIHLEETSEALSNGQMLLEALEQGEILAAGTSSTPTSTVGGAAEIKEEESVKRKRDGKSVPVPAKKAKQENILEKAMELAKIEDDEQQQQPLAPPTLAPAQLGQVVLVGNQVLVSSSTTSSTTVVPTSQIDALHHQQPQQSANVADTKTFFVANQANTNKAFLILQPQGSRFVLGGPRNQKMVLTVRPPTQAQPQQVSIPIQSQVPAVQVPGQGVSHGNALVTDSSAEGIVTFSGGAVAIPAKNIPKPPIPMTVRAVAPVPVVTSVAVPGMGTGNGTSGMVTTVTQTPLPAVVTTVPLGNGTGIEVSNSTGSSVTITPVIPPIKRLENEELAYICEWKGCGKSCKSPTELYLHACHVHCPLTFEEGLCQWDKCDNLKRRRFSLMTHLQDRHCNEEVQRVLALRRQQLSALGKTDIQPLPVPPPHPGYAPHAALQAIKRHALEYMNQKDSPEEKEGPVTKSIRLTAALILRNLVIYSSLGRRCLRRYEPLLCAIALSPVESARTVSQLLYDMANPNTNTSALP